MVGNKSYGGEKLLGALLGPQEAQEAKNRDLVWAPGVGAPQGPPCRPALFSRLGLPRILTYLGPTRARLGID